MRLLVATFILAPLLAFCQSMTSPGVGQLPQKFDTIAQLVARPGTNNQMVYVRGYRSVGDWGAERQARFIPGTASTNLGCDFATTGGRWSFPDCETGELKAEWFGAQPYQSLLMTPWAYQTNIAAIGTGDFSVWARIQFPTNFSQPMGWFSITARPELTNVVSNPVGSAFSFRATPQVFGFLGRATNGSSAAGVDVNGGSLLNTTNVAAFNAYLGQTVDFVFTRAGTNVHAYIDGTNIDALLVNENPEGWAKSVGLGYPLLLQIGSQENRWYWPHPIERFGLWTSSLTAGQAADPAGAAGKTVDWSPVQTDEPIDNSAAIQAAIDYASSRGGGTVLLQEGKYRLDSGLRLKPRTTLVGRFGALYPSSGGVVVYGFGSTVLVPWFGTDLDTISILQSDMSKNDISLSLRSLFGISGVASSLFAYCAVKDLAIYGEFSHSGRGIFLDRVGSVEISGVSFNRVPGFTIYGLVNNLLNILNCSGIGGRSVHLRAGADSKLIGNFFDNQYGPSLWHVGNLNVIIGNVFEVSLNPTSGSSPWQDTVTADDVADTLTVSLGQGHRLRNGDVVRFLTSGTLPAPLAVDTDYYVSVVDASTFKVYASYANEIALTGAIYGTGNIDLTDTGVGTHSVSPGPSVGILHSGDNTPIIGNNSHLNWGSALRLELARWNPIQGNSFVMNGWNNPDTNSSAGIQLVNGSIGNRIIGNGIDDRDTVEVASQYGIVGCTNCVDNYIVGNSINVSFPYSVASDNFVSDVSQQISRYPHHSLYIPAAAGFGAQTPVYGTNTASIQYDITSRRLFLSSGTASGLDSWDYAVAFDLIGPNYWSAGAGSTLSANNSSTNSAAMTYFKGAYNDAFTGLTVSDTNSSKGVRSMFTRNRAETGLTYEPLLSGDQIAELIFNGVSSTNAVNAGDIVVGASIEAVTGSDWNPASSEGRLNFRVTPTGSVSRAVQLSVRGGGRLNFAGQATAPTTGLSDGDVYWHNSIGPRAYLGGQFNNLLFDAPSNSVAYVRSNGLWTSVGGPYLPLSGGTMSGGITMNKLYTGADLLINTWDTNAAAQGSRIFLWRTKAQPVGSIGPVLAGDQLGEVLFGGSSGTDGASYRSSASIEAVPGSNWSTNSSEGRMYLKVTPNGSSSRVTQVQILDQGRIQLTAQTSDPTNAVADGQLYYNSALGTFRSRAASAWVSIPGASTSYSFTNGLTNSAGVVSWAAVPGSNISFATNNGQITISSSNGTTNSGTAVSVDGAATMVAANFADSTELNPTASGSNVTYAIVTASIATNKIDATFHGLLTAADLVGSGTNIFVNALLVSQANLQDDTGAGGINFVVSGSNIKAYATNVAHGLTHTNGLTNSAGVVQWAVSAGTNVTLTTNNGQITIAASATGTSYSFTNGLTNSAGVVQWAVAQGANVTLTTNNGQVTIAASTGSTNDLYIAKNVTKVSISNTVDETTVYAWTIPADTLNANGDELEFYVPAKYLEYNGQTNGYRWDFYIDRSQPGESATTGNYVNALASISTSFMADWTVRVKRMSATEALLIAKHICGADGSGDTTNVITTSRYLEHTIVNGWDQDMGFELTFTPGVTNMNHGIVAYGSTVRKLR